MGSPRCPWPSQSGASRWSSTSPISSSPVSVAITLSRKSGPAPPPSRPGYRTRKRLPSSVFSPSDRASALRHRTASARSLVGPAGSPASLTIDRELRITATSSTEAPQDEQNECALLYHARPAIPQAPFPVLQNSPAVSALEREACRAGSGSRRLPDYRSRVRRVSVTRSAGTSLRTTAWPMPSRSTQLMAPLEVFLSSAIAWCTVF